MSNLPCEYGWDLSQHWASYSFCHLPLRLSTWDGYADETCALRCCWCWEVSSNLLPWICPIEHCPHFLYTRFEGSNTNVRSAHWNQPNYKFYDHNTRKKESTSEYKQSSTSHGCVHILCFSNQILIPSQGLIKSTTRQDQQEGVRLLSDIFRTAPERRRECLYYLALGNYKLGNYAEARRYNDLLLDKEPANMQAASLRSLIDDRVAKEGLMGVAILSGVAIAAGVVGGMIFKGVGRRAR